MRRILPYIFLIGLCLFLYDYSRQTREDIKVEHGYFKEGPFPVVLETYKNRYICNDCGMMIKTYKNSTQAITKNGDVYFFDDIGCMLSWMKKQNYKDEDLRLYVFATDTKAYIEAELAWYIRDANTPIGYGFGAYETSIGAITSSKTRSSIESQIGDFKVKNENKEIYSFEEIKQFSLRGETLLNPMIKHQILNRK